MTKSIRPEQYPHLTVATVVERDGLFLFVEEIIDDQHVFNQPAGHVEPGESLLDAALRETLEETGWTVELTALLGCSRYRAGNGVDYHRISFAATPLVQRHAAAPDADIFACHWWSMTAAQQRSARMRSPLVLDTLGRHIDGRRFPLDFCY